MLDDVCEDFRDRLLSPTGEHHIEVGATTVSGPKPIPSNATKISREKCAENPMDCCQLGGVASRRDEEGKLDSGV